MAWDELYHQFHGGLIASINRIFGKRQWDFNLADEIASRVWYAVVANGGELLGRFDPQRDCRLSTYLATIARGEASKFFRSERRRRANERVASHSESAVTNELCEWTQGALQEFLLGLTPREQEFLLGFLMSPVQESKPLTYSDANRWQLSGRIRNKLRIFLDPN